MGERRTSDREERENTKTQKKKGATLRDTVAARSQCAREARPLTRALRHALTRVRAFRPPGAAARRVAEHLERSGVSGALRGALGERCPAPTAPTAPAPTVRSG